MLSHNDGDVLASVRLVHGAAWVGQRHLVSSLGYPGDSANNVVIDRQTGLTWRRCEEGQTWNGATCVGKSSFVHEAALARANSIVGWRLANIKELESLMDYGLSNPPINTQMFPVLGATGDVFYMSSTPDINTSSKAFQIFVDQGAWGSILRNDDRRVLLVITGP